MTVKIPQDRTHQELLSDYMSRTANSFRVLHGEDEHNRPVTLFGCGSWRTNTTAGLGTYQFRNIGTAILNFHGESWEDAYFPVASVSYTLLDRWMNRPLGVVVDMEGGFTSLKFKSQEVLEFDLQSGVRLRIDATRVHYDSSELSLVWHHRIWFLFSESLSAREVHDDYASVFLRLLCLLTGELVFIEKFEFFSRDPFKPGESEPIQNFELLHENRGITNARRETHAAHMIVGFPEIEADFGHILNRWFECHKQLKPVLDLYFAIISNQFLALESRFLFLAQAMEVYHVRSPNFTGTDLPSDQHKIRLGNILKSAPGELQFWLKEKLSFSNNKTLAQRLDDILKSHNEAEELTGSVDGFAEKVRHTRNYYTHYDEEARNKGKVAKGLELTRIVFALEDLLQVCLLKELGIEGEPIKRILQRNASVKYADSHDIKKG